MKISYVLLLGLILCCACGCICLAEQDLSEGARALIPNDAEITQDQTHGPYRVITLQLPTGEELFLALDAQTGIPLHIVTGTPALPLDNGTSSVQPADALYAAYPEACLLITRDGEDGQHILTFFTPVLCGEAVFQGGQILQRSLDCGEYMQDGVLSMEGALTILRLQRPNATVCALEMDYDDGIISYEGDALEGGMKYEFEMNALNGRLMEWERD